MTHETSVGRSDDWLTPPWIIEKLGPFDLDPCASVRQPWDTATEMRTEKGLQTPWNGFVWCNPPYSNTGPWLDRMRDHNNGIALIFARTDSKRWESIWRSASGFLFLFGRIRFRRPVTGLEEGPAGAASVLVAYGPEALTRLRHSGVPGALLGSAQVLSSTDQRPLNLHGV